MQTGLKRCVGSPLSSTPCPLFGPASRADDVEDDEEEEGFTHVGEHLAKVRPCVLHRGGARDVDQHLCPAPPAPKVGLHQLEQKTPGLVC